MASQWRFIQDDQAQWRWKRVDEARGDVDSPDTFECEIDCILDAVRYVVQQAKSPRLQ
jgi:hypothetical protein